MQSGHNPKNMPTITDAGTCAAPGPRQDLRQVFEAEVRSRHGQAASVLLGVGRLAGAGLRFAEVLLALLPDWAFTREPDAVTGNGEWIPWPVSR